MFFSYKFLAPSEHSGIDIPHLDKIGHLIVFALLSFFSHKAYQLAPKSQLMIWAIYGAVIEILQGFTGYRSADVLDWLADMLGVVVVITTIKILHSSAANASKTDINPPKQSSR